MQTKVRAAFIVFFFPTTALIEADAIRPAIISYKITNKFILK